MLDATATVADDPSVESSFAEALDDGPEADPGRAQAHLRLAASFLGYLRPARRHILFVVAATILAAACHLPMIFLPKVLTEHFDDRAYVAGFLGLVLGTFVVGSGLSVLQSYWTASIGESVVRALRRDLFERLERLNMGAVYGRGPGPFVQQVGKDVAAVRELLSEALVHAGMDVADGVAVLLAMLALQPLSTVILLAGFASLVWLIRWINRQVERHAGRAREQLQEIMGRLVEYVGGFRDILAAGRFRRVAAQFDELLVENQHSNVRTAVWGQTSGLVPAMMVSLGMLGCYYFGWRGAEDVAQVGALITYAALLGQLFPAFFALTRTSTDLAMAVPSLRALREILDCPARASRPGAVPLLGPIRSIRFDHVTLELDGRRIVQDLSFEVPGGRLTAIVGQSGAGKTTIIHLLLRLLEPTAGTICINDRPLEDYTRESLHAQLGYLPQNPFIFNQSLRENMLLAAPEEPTPQRLAASVAAAQLNEIVELRQDQGGLEAEAGYLGNRLSGGEKQRLALARLLLRDPAVVICDEYTANVDAKTAQWLRRALRGLFADRTRVVITHELASARGADKIIVIDAGRVVQHGTHEQLQIQAGLYRELLEAQRV